MSECAIGACLSRERRGACVNGDRAAEVSSGGGARRMQMEPIWDGIIELWVGSSLFAGVRSTFAWDVFVC